MATNGFSRAGRSGRTPHFLTVGLLVVICILAFNYWNVSSQNKMLQKEREEMTRNLEELALRRVHLEKRSEALDNQLRENNQNIQALTNDKNSCLTSLKDTGDERDDLRVKFKENDAQLKDLQKELETTNQQLDDKYDQLRTIEQKLIDAQNHLQIKEHQLAQYIDSNTQLEQTVQNLSIEKDQCVEAYHMLESKQKQLQLQQHQQPQGNQVVPQANVPVPPQNDLPPDLRHQQPQQPLLNRLPPAQTGGQLNLGPQVPGNFQVPGVPNVPVYVKQSGGDQLNGRVPQFPDLKFNNIPVPGDSKIPGDPDNKISDDDAQKIEVGGDVNETGEGEVKKIDEQDGQRAPSEENNDDSKPMVHVDPGMVNQLESEDGVEPGRDDGAQEIDGRVPEDADEQVDDGSPALKDDNGISNNGVADGVSNMDSEPEDDDEDNHKADEGPSADDDESREQFRDMIGDEESSSSSSSSGSSYEFESDKDDGGLQIDKADVIDVDNKEGPDDYKLRFEGREIENQLNPLPNGR